MLIAVLAMAFHKEMILALDKVFDIMSPITMAILMALILDPYMAWICNHLPLKDQKVKIAVSTTITYILMLLIVGSMIIIIGPRLTKSILDFAGNFPNMLKNLETFINTNINGLDINENAKQIVNAYDIIKIIQDTVNNISSSVGGILSKLGNFLFEFSIAIVIAIGLSLNRDKLRTYMNDIINICFPKRKGTLFLACHRIEDSLSGFIVGRLLDSLLFGALMGFVMYKLKIPYWDILALIIGLTNVIPVIGATIGFVIGMVLLLMIDPSKILAFAIWNNILKWIDGNILGPVIIGKSIGMPPVLVMIVVIICGGFGGIMGIIVEVPLCATCYQFFDDWYQNNKKNTDVDIQKPVNYNNIE